MSEYRFPAGFLWGAATSSHQVEGDNRWNDWWEHEQAGRLPFRSGNACQHWERYEQDFDLAHAWGHNAHRLSIEWSRIEPAPNSWNLAALAHYRRVIDALRERNLEPIVTLHHFTNPRWFAALGGWERRNSQELFARYVERIADALGSRVRYYLTVNEPTVYIKRAYVTGDWPPFVHAARRRALVVLWNQMRAHRAAYRILHRHQTDVRVGIAHSAPLVVPCDPRRTRDRIAAGLQDFVLNRLPFLLLSASPGRRRPRYLDFIGLNYYTRNIVRGTGWDIAGLLGRSCGGGHHVDAGPMSDTGWEIYAPGLERVLRRFAALGLPLLISENGIATRDETLRSEFIRQHLVEVGRALQSGIDVIGYLYWTLMDNFEWTLGTTAFFGLAGVDFESQQRSPRPAAACLASICRANRLSTTSADHSEASPVSLA